MSSLDRSFIDIVVAVFNFVVVIAVVVVVMVVVVVVIVVVFVVVVTGLSDAQVFSIAFAFASFVLLARTHRVSVNVVLT